MYYLFFALFIGIVLGGIGMDAYFNRNMRLVRKAKGKATLRKFRIEILGEDIEVMSLEHADELVNMHLDPAIKIAINLDRLLQEDMDALLDEGDDSERGRRRLIREVVSYAEAVCSGYQKVGAIALAIYGKEELIPHYSKTELKAIFNKPLTTRERLKALTSVGHKVFFHGETGPNFGGEGWSKACSLIDKRHSITHPISANSVAISEADWPDLHAGALFLLGEIYRPNQLMQEIFQAEEQG
jgi:hypothetical protein